MSKIDELVKEFCPEGVKFVKFTDLGIFESIGVDKKIVDGEKPVKLLNYMDVYKNHYIDASIPTMTVTASDAKISKCSVEAGDIFITPTSETRDDIGHSAVAIETIEGAVYSYHIMRFRLFNPEMVTSFFLNYVFESGIVQKQILKAAQGMTRYGVSAKKFSEFSVPIPPLEVQKEIVNILDKFTLLEAGLSTELDARRRQYEYYKNTLLKPSEEVSWQTIGEVCEVGDGNHSSSYPKASEMVDQGIPFIRGTNIVDGTISGKDMKYISEEKHIKLKKGHLRANDVLVTNRGEVGKIALIPEKFANSNLNSQIAWLRTDNKILLPKYLFFIMNANFIQNKIIGEGGALKQLTIKNLKLLKIPVPSINKQEEIVNVLDNFDTLTNNKMVGIPAEIDARRRQYEYYRTKLLTFQELSV